jgi:glycosyltransferase involved in cell wall biosynthesis
MRLMRELDWHVIFVADDGGEYEPYTSRVRRAGIEVIPHRGDALDAIRRIPVSVDLAWVSRPDLLEKYMPELRRRTTAKIVYDTVDLHHVRLQREAHVTGRQNGWEAMRELEYHLARRSDCVVVTSSAEHELLDAAGIPSHVVPIIEEPVRTRAAYVARQDLLLLANYTHEPNADAAIWLVTEIMPRVWERIPNLQITLAGAEPTPAVARLAGDRVRVTGYVPDVRPLFESARLFVAPLRYGAGMKGKIVQSLAHGLPVITTSIGAEGIGIASGENGLIADDVRAFANGILQLYSDEALWSQVAAQSLQTAQQFAPNAVRAKIARVLEAALEPEVPVGIDRGLSTYSA